MIYLHQIDPIALHIGNGGVHWYGIMYLLGFAAAWFLGRSRVRAGRLPGVNADSYGDLMFYAMLGVVLGGRIGYILFYDLRVYIDHPLQVLKIWEGGMSFHGGLLGVMAAMLWWARRHKLQFFDVADFIAPLVPPGLGFGRLGNFINGELWGKPTGGDWGVAFPQSLGGTLSGLDATNLRAQFESGALNLYARHPSQLYQFALEGVAMFCILWWYSRKPRPRYAVSGWFAVLYGVFRFAVEFVRLPDPQVGYLAFGWLTMGQALSVPLVLIGVFWLWKSRRAPVLQSQPAAQAGAA